MAGSLPWFFRILYPYEILVLLVFFMSGWSNKFNNPNMNQNSVNKKLNFFGLAFIAFIFIGAMINMGNDKYQDIISISRLNVPFLEWKLFANVVLTVIVCFTGFISGRNFVSTRGDIYIVPWTILIASVMASVSSIIVWLTETGGVISRYNFEPPTGLGQGDTSRMALIGILMSIYLIFYSRKKIERNLAIVSLVFVSVCVMIIQSRNAYISTIAHIILVILVFPKNRSRKEEYKRKLALWTIGIFAITFIIVVAIETGLIESLQNGLLKSESSDMANRIAVQMDGVRIFLENPFFGVGWGQFPLYCRVPMMVSGKENFVASPHNGIIDLLSGIGLIGTILTLLISVYLIRLIWFIYKNVNVEKEKTFIGIILIMVTYSVIAQLIVSSTLFPPPQRSAVRIPFIYWFLAGYVLSIGEKSAKNS